MPTEGAAPFIGSLPVGGPMAASVGDHVTPGSPVKVDSGINVGDGIHISENGPIAILSGNLVNNSGVISVDSSAPPINSPKMGLLER